MHEGEAGAHGIGAERRRDDGFHGLAVESCDGGGQRGGVEVQRAGEARERVRGNRRQRGGRRVRNSARVQDQKGGAPSLCDFLAPLGVMRLARASAQFYAQGVAVCHQTLGDGGDAGDDAAVGCRAARVDRDHLAGGGIADRPGAAFDQPLHQPTVGIGRAPDQDGVGVGADAPCAIRCRRRGRRRRRCCTRLHFPSRGAGCDLGLPAVRGLGESKNFAVVVEGDAEAGGCCEEGVDHGLAAAEQEGVRRRKGDAGVRRLHADAAPHQPVRDFGDLRPRRGPAPRSGRRRRSFSVRRKSHRRDRRTACARAAPHGRCENCGRGGRCRRAARPARFPAGARERRGVSRRWPRKARRCRRRSPGFHLRHRGHAMRVKTSPTPWISPCRKSPGGPGRRRRACP